MNAKFLDKLDFYQNAYQEELNQAKAIRLTLEELKLDLNNYTQEKITDWLGKDLDEEERNTIEQMGVSLNTIFEEIEKARNIIPREIDNIRNGQFYQKYLEMTINHDFSLIYELEDDQTFNYLISKNFHNNQFDNRPKIKIPFLGTFQPRYKKFAKIAQLVSQRHSFESYIQMFSTWQTMRDAFKEVLGENKISDAKVKFKRLQEEIKQKNQELNNLAHKEMSLIIDKVSGFIINAKKFSLSTLLQEEINYIDTQKEQIRIKDQNLILAQNTINQIMNNMALIQEISLNAHKVSDNQNIMQKLKHILEVKDPGQDLYEILTMEEWQIALDAFKAYDEEHFKSAKVHYDEAKYSVTDLTPEQIQYLMKKYNVKEGEAFEPDPEDIRKLKLMH